MKIIKRITIFVIIVIVGSLAIRAYFQSRLPRLSGEIKLTGLKKPVTIYRDKYSIPHIKAENRLDAMRALGFTIAGDRLFHMDLLRRVTNGELSEIFGPRAKNWDIVLRKLRIRKTMDDYLKKNRKDFDPKILQEMEAFYQGVQFFIDTEPLPIEFLLLNYKPRPFVLAESLALTGYMALSFAEGIISDTLYSELYTNYPKEKIQELDIQVSEDKNYIINYNTSFKKKKKASYTKEKWFTDLNQTLKDLENEFGLFHGSNSWVVSAKKSKSGFPLFANDPHIAFSNPSVWYEAHIQTPDLDIYGQYLALLPFPAIGHNKDRAWAMTMAEVDDLDIYEEKIDWKENKVMFKNEWVSLKIEQEVLKIKGEKDYKFKVYSTPHGPLIDGTKYEKKGKHLSIKWSYHHPENNVAEALYKLRESKTINDFKKALSLAAAPALSISWADKAGNIGYHIMSKIPLRPEGVSGRFVLNGWSGEHEYLRYLNFSENPHLYNPESGVIINANYKPEFKSNHEIGGYYQPSDRIERIDKLLKSKEKWSLNEFKKIQTDSVSHFGPKQLNFIIPMLEVRGQNLRYLKAIEILRAWNGKSSVESIGASLYYQWKKEIMREALADDLTAEQFKSFLSIADAHHFFKKMIFNPKSLWWDKKGTSLKETEADIVNSSFKKMLKELEEKLGEDISDWNWGKIHTLEFNHPIGKMKPLDLLFNIGPFPVTGGYSEINNMSAKRYMEDFKVTTGPSTRRLIDFNDATISFGIIPTGNSGQPFSKHYDDQSALYIANKYRPQFLNLDDVKKLNGEVLKLNP